MEFYYQNLNPASGGNETADIRYDPNLRTCKSPFGAVKSGAKVHFAIAVSVALQPKQVALLLQKDGFPPEQTLLTPGSISDGMQQFSGITAPCQTGLYFYQFALTCQNGSVLHAGKNSDGAAQLCNTTFGAAQFCDALQKWPLLVYDKDFTVPGWTKNAVMYQIFPDRYAKSDAYCAGQAKNDRYIHANWQERPKFIFDEPGYEATDFFMGNLQGITEHLDDIKRLGVTVLYLNPIFESAANHRYNTGDYFSVDPYLGDTEDFKNLCSAAKKRGIHVLLDGVFSHTGADSIYFNKYGNYPGLGAYQSTDSPYYRWYSFGDSKEAYDCWWNFKTLPNVRETEPSYLDFICNPETGVLAYWLKNGASGWRLDVADELPDEFLQALRRAVKQVCPEALIIGEVWENAVLKESYGARRKFLQGRQLDTVMNYPLKQAIVAFIKTRDSRHFCNAVCDLLQTYPQPALQCMMNLLSSHDTARIITELGESGTNTDPHEKGSHIMAQQDLQAGKRRFVLASILQYFLPGIPCIYYGDEAGMYGFADPWNRKCYPWGSEDHDLIAHFQHLGQIKQENAALFCGDYHLEQFANGVVRLSFQNKALSKGIFAVVNLSDYEYTVHLSTRTAAAPMPQSSSPDGDLSQWQALPRVLISTDWQAVVTEGSLRTNPGQATVYTDYLEPENDLPL